jgi:hypothetical protein
MEALNIQELDKKTKVKANKYEPKIIEVVPTFIIWIIGIMFVGIVTMGGVLYSNRELLVNDWKAQIHAMTEPQKAQAKEEPKAVIVTPKPSPSPTVVTIDSNSKGGCDLKTSELSEGVCYPKAGY